MNQEEFTGIFCARPQNLAWFLGAGASRTAGLPTATDIIWDLKRRYYCQQENQDISRQDIQNEAIRQRIQSFMESRGFPALWTDGEYETYFEKIFGDDRERQRKYLNAMLAEEQIRLSAGCRVLGGLMASGLCRTVFTTNFDSVVEKAVAAVGKRSLSPYHLEAPHAALNALNNEEFPLYCKLHGDFRYDSLKNLPEDLAAQNDELARCMVTAGNRFGFVVTGYSGRDASVMELFRSVLQTPNPFPHGLYWTGIKGAPVPPAVEQLLAESRERGVSAQPREDERGRNDVNRDPGWSWSRKAVASLIAKGMDSESNRIPIEAREQVWRILEPVTWDPDPSVERDAERDEDDPFHVAINSVRGEAMLTVIRYAVWIDRHARETVGNAPGLAGMPEVERNMSQHLDFDREPSPAVRSVLGQAFPAIHWLDSRWASDHVERIFMLPADSVAARGAWATYLRFCRPFDDLFPLLEPLYRSTVGGLDPEAALKADIDSVEYHLTTHVMSFMWRGVAGSERLARELMSRGGEGVRHVAFDFIGRSLMDAEGEISEETLARIRSVWEWWRQEGAARHLLGKEVGAFGWWFASERFDPGWADAQANWVLVNGSALEPDHVVVERLETRVNRDPLAAVRILDGLWESIRDQWTFYGWRDECRNILQRTLASDSDEAKQVARALINKIAARGHLEFRGLLT
ncbi:MAG TPA: SIR2 family protein [Vicinamibacterales bacterium]|nr:SIR2 family protein [Vicinamibacterales bacterium]